MKYTFLLLFLCYTSVQAQKTPGPRSVAMGSAGIAVQDIWALQQNPAGITGIGGLSLAIAYEKHFLDQEISTQLALLAIPHGKGVFGFSTDRYGFAEYREQHAGIAYARKFGSSFSLAVGFKFHQLNIAGYGSSTAFSAEVGFQLAINENLTLGSYIVNPSRSKYKDITMSNIPVKLSFGAAYRFSDKVIVAADVIKVLNSSTDTRLGLEYSLIKNFSLRGGISANPFRQYAGFGFMYNRLSVDAAVSVHQTLGYSPQIGLGYEF